MKKMKVLFVSHYEGINGAPKSMISLMCALRKRDVQVMAVLPDYGMLEEELKKNELEYCIIKTKRCFYEETNRKEKLCSYLNEIYNLKAVYQMIKVIREFDPDIVHSNSYAIDVGAFAAYLTKKPHIWHFREFMKEDFGFVHNIERKAVWLAQKSTKIIAVSNVVKEYYEKTKGIENISVIHNGIEKGTYGIEKKTPLKDDKLKLLISGTISEKKGQKEALEACRVLYNRGYSNFHLSIIGSAKRVDLLSLKRNRNRYQLNKYVKFYNFQSDMVAVRERMDVELVCSVSEAFGRVTIEAMMADMLVIGANTGGTKELIQDGVNGILYQQGNATDLANKIEDVINNREKYVECVRNGKKYAIDNFDISITAQKVLKIYQEIMKR